MTVYLFIAKFKFDMQNHVWLILRPYIKFIEDTFNLFLMLLLIKLYQLNKPPLTINWAPCRKWTDGKDHWHLSIVIRKLSLDIKEESDILTPVYPTKHRPLIPIMNLTNESLWPPLNCFFLLNLIFIYSQTCLMWPSKGTVKYGHLRQVVV